MTEKENNIAENDQPAWLDGSQLDEVLFCESFLADTLYKRFGRHFYSVDGIVPDDEFIKSEIYQTLRPYLKTQLSEKTKKLFEVLKLEAFTGQLPIHEDRIDVANGTLYLDGTFEEKKIFCRNRLPVAYNPDASQPEQWLHFLSDLLDPVDILTLQEFMGYCLLPTTKGQRMLVIRGSGGEGKSRVGVIMHTLMGKNAKNGSVAKVETNAFARADLEGELVMVDDDMNMAALKTTHYLKSIVSAEVPVDLERKKEQSYQGDLYVRFLTFTNGELISLYDHSDGFFRRQLILSAKRKDPNRADDPFLVDKLKKEIEGIFLWCLEGLYRLLANNYEFTESEQTKENREAAKRDSKNVLLFLQSEGYIRLNADSSIPTADLYTLYCTWCLDNAVKPLSMNTVGKILNQHAHEFNLEHDNHVRNSLGKRVNGYWGIEALSRPAVI